MNEFKNILFVRLDYQLNLKQYFLTKNVSFFMDLRIKNMYFLKYILFLF